MKTNWCLLLSGMPRSGKSTIAYNLVHGKIRNALIIDGDRHREMQFLGEKLGFSKEDIMKNTWHVIKMAQFAQEQNMNVIISQITPYKEQRDLMRKEIKNFFEVYLYCPDEERMKRPNYKETELIYELGNPDLSINTYWNTLDESCNLILEKM